MFRNKIWLLLSALLLAACPAWATIAHGQQGCNSGNGSSFLIAPGGPTQNGNVAEVVIVAIRTISVSVSSVTDTSSDSYTQQAAITGTNERIELWVAWPVATSQGSVTVNLFASSKTVACVSDYGAVQALGVTATNTLAGLANPSIALTTQDANNWCVAGFAGQGTNAFSAGTGNLRGNAFTGGGSGASNVGGAENDNTVASPGSCTNKVTNADTDWSMAAIELRSTSGATCPKTLLLMGVGC